MKKKNCPYCPHIEIDYHCPCFHDGFETADAEQCFNKLQEQRETLLEVFEGMETKNTKRNYNF